MTLLPMPRTLKGQLSLSFSLRMKKCAPENALVNIILSLRLEIAFSCSGEVRKMTQIVTERLIWNLLITEDTEWL